MTNGWGAPREQTSVVDMGSGRSTLASMYSPSQSGHARTRLCTVLIRRQLPLGWPVAFLVRQGAFVGKTPLIRKLSAVIIRKLPAVVIRKLPALIGKSAALITRVLLDKLEARLPAGHLADPAAPEVLFEAQPLHACAQVQTR